MKDEEKDKVVWQEYLSNVLKKRGAEWRPLFTACSEHNCVTAGRIHVFGVRHLSPAGRGTSARTSTRSARSRAHRRARPTPTDLIPDMTRKGTRPPIAILAYTDFAPGAHARLPARPLQPGVSGDLLGEGDTTPRSSSSTCRPTSSSACRTSECELLREGRARRRRGTRRRSRRRARRPMR